MASCFRSPLRRLLPALATAAFLSPAAWAGPVISRAALDAMLGVGASKETFESYPVAAGSNVGVGTSLSSTSTPNGQSAGLIAPGVTLSTSNGVVLWQGANYFKLPTKTIGANIGTDIIIDFTVFTNAVGLDLLNYGGYAATYDVTAFGLDDTTILQSFTGINFPKAVTPTFFGFEHAAGVGRVSVVAVAGFGPVIDNLTFGTVPEPASLALVGLSLLVLRVTRRV